MQASYSNAISLTANLLSTRSRMNQNLIIDSRGLRAGRKVFLKSDALPERIRASHRDFCIALRGPADIETIVHRLADDTQMLEGKKESDEYDGTFITSRINRVVLVAPNFDRNGGFILPPMGIERMAAYLRSTDPCVDVETVDPTLLGRQGTYYHLMRLKRPDIIGFSSITQSLKNDIELMAELSARYFNSGKPVTLMGNSGVMLGAEALLSSLPFLDGVVVGPGEFILSSILSSMKNGHGSQNDTLEDINRNAYDPAVLVTRSSAGPKQPGFPSVNPQQLIMLQKALDYLLVPFEEYWEVNGTCGGDIMFHISTVSCSRGCLYCAAPKGKTSFLPAENVTEMFSHARTAYPGVSRFVFSDDNLFSGRKYVSALLNAIRNSAYWNPGLQFAGYARADSFDPQSDGVFLDELKETGFREIVVGAEAFSAQLGQLNKGVDAERTLGTISLLGKNGFDVEADLILFTPNITLMDLFDTIERAVQISKTGKVFPAVSPLLLAFPGAPLTEKIMGRSGPWMNSRQDVQKALGQDWISKVNIEYETIGGINIPHHFKIIRPLMEKLFAASLSSAQELFETLTDLVGTEIGDEYLPNLLLFWVIAANVDNNSALFNEKTAGKDAGRYVKGSARLQDMLESAISTSCDTHATGVINVLHKFKETMRGL